MPNDRVPTITSLEPWYLDNLVCPKDRQQLQWNDGHLVCAQEHVYPVIEGVPVMLLDNVQQTMWVANQSLVSVNAVVAKENQFSHLYLNTIGIGEEGRERLSDKQRWMNAEIDPVVAELVGATNGLMYQHLIGKLNSYPIPVLRLPDGDGRSLLDVGCNWGRWCIAAARKGYAVVGIDPSLGAILTARRVSRSLGVSVHFVVADARYLPFPPNHFDQVFSYSVLQHFSLEDCKQSVIEIGRVLKAKGNSIIQMPTKLGIRCLFHQARRGFREARDFEVRYWSLAELKKMFTMAIGQVEFSVDCFFGIGLQPSDYHLMTPKLKAVLLASEVLRKVSNILPFMIRLADSVYVKAIK